MVYKVTIICRVANEKQALKVIGKITEISGAIIDKAEIENLSDC